MPRPAQAAAHVCAERDQIALHLACLDDLLAPEHEARAVWGFVERLDLTALYAAIKSVEGGAGHPVADPKVLSTYPARA